jgi:uncharacterized membrane protein
MNSSKVSNEIKVYEQVNHHNQDLCLKKNSLSSTDFKAQTVSLAIIGALVGGLVGVIVGIGTGGLGFVAILIGVLIGGALGIIAGKMHNLILSLQRKNVNHNQVKSLEFLEQSKSHESLNNLIEIDNKNNLFDEDKKNVKNINETVDLSKDEDYNYFDSSMHFRSDDPSFNAKKLCQTQVDLLNIDPSTFPLGVKVYYDSLDINEKKICLIDIFGSYIQNGLINLFKAENGILIKKFDNVTNNYYNHHYELAPNKIIPLFLSMLILEDKKICYIVNKVENNYTVFANAERMENFLVNINKIPGKKIGFINKCTTTYQELINGDAPAIV